MDVDKNLLCTNLKKLPKDYLILKLRMSINKELYEKNVISFEIYNRMQKLLINRMEKIILEYK